MAIYHLAVKIIGRSSGRSSVAAACYRSGDTITNKWDGVTHDYSKKNWIEHTEILLPPNAPSTFKDRATLWNSVELAEKSGNAQLAREIEIALPHELTIEQQIALTRAYIEQNFVSVGMCADFAIHNPPVTDDKHRPIDIEGNPTNDPYKMTFRNPHAHIMLTMRPLNDRGEWESKSQKNYICRKGNEEKSIPAPNMKQAELDGWSKQYQYKVGKKKIWLTEESAAKKDLKRINKNPKAECVQNATMAVWNSKDSIFRWRESWASMCNQALQEHGINEQIDHRSYEEQGINKVASVHLGPSAYQMEKRGQNTELGSLNREIAEDNIFLEKFQKQIELLEQRETERLQKVSSRLEGLRSQYIAATYQQILLSATLASEQNQIQTQIATAAAYAKATEDILKFLDNLEQSIRLRRREQESLNPLHIQRRKELEQDILDTEKQIQAAKHRLSEIQKAYKQPDIKTTPDTEVLEKKKDRIQNLRRIQSQTFKEFYALVEENKANMKELRDLIRGKRTIYDTQTEQKLKEHYADKFDKATLAKARAQAPELPEPDGAGIKNIISHKR